MRIPLTVSLLLSACASLASAQQVQLNAIVEPAADPACPGFDHRVAATDVLLDDALVDLAPFADKLVRLEGVLLPAGCATPVVQVTAVTAATATLESCGTPRPGCEMRFRVGPPTVSQNWLAFSAAPEAFLSLGDPTGVLFLGAPLVVLPPAGPQGVFDVSVPSAGLIGVTLHAQGLHLEVGPIGGPPHLSNPVQIPIVLGPACVDPGSCGF